MDKQAIENTKEPIAIIGMGCRYPGEGNSPQEFWENLLNGVDGIVDVPEDRWDREAMYHPDFNTSGKISVKKGGFIRSVDQFDASFFGISPIEAVRMDPQQRILLEVTHQAMEDAGAKVEELNGSKTGVFIGISSHDYGDIQQTPSDRLNIGANTQTGGALSIASNRISYIFNFKGPSFCVDTACSSSLTAIHLACKSIWSDESEMAFAGGVNLILKPESQIGFSKGGFLAPDGHCKSFDASANGYIRSEGAGVIFLKPLSKAQEDGDDIYATIIGTAINQDGKTNGMTVPNGDSQIEMLEEAISDAGISPVDISYVEAHGTGTPVGDPIETRSIGSVVGNGRAKERPCYIGSVKSNIGHLEPASGIAGISKLILAMKNEKIPPNINFNNPNPDIPFEELNLKVPTEVVDWKQNGKPRYAGVNSFGFGGANAHVVLQSAPTDKVEKENDEVEGPKLFVLSAKSKDALSGLANDYIEFIKSTDDSLTDICFNLGAKRSVFEHRLSIAAATKEDLAEKLQAYVDEESRAGMNAGRSKADKKHKVGFIFSGQGPQWFGMGRELIKEEPVFKEIILKIDGLLSQLADWSLLEELSRDEKSSRISETRIAQPAIMAIQIALTELWKASGVSPDGVVGHSIGEVAAAYAAGAINLEEAVEVIYHRSRGQDQASGKGKMLAVGLTLTDAKNEINGIEDKVSIATINGPTNIVLSGDSDELEKIADKLDEKDIFHRFLRINVPFHSHFMEPLKDELISSLEHVKGKTSAIDLYSTVTGQKESGTHLDTQYWYRNVREPVYFTDALQAMIEDGFNTFVEVAPHPILSTGANEMLEKSKQKGLVVTSIRRKEPEKMIFTGSLGQLYIDNYPMDWKALFKGERKSIKLPFYAWQKDSFWLEDNQTEKDRMGSFEHPHLNKENRSTRESENILWDIDLDKRKDPYIIDHKVQGPIVYPGAGHVELALSCGIQSFGDSFSFLEDLNFKTALFLPDEGVPPEIQIDISSDNGDYFLYMRPRNSGAPWTLCSNGKMNHSGDSFVSNPIDLAEKKKSLVDDGNVVDIKGLHENLYDAGLELGPSFRAIKNLWANGKEAISEVEVPESIRHGFEKFNLHPSILDSCFQTLFGVYFKTLLPDEKMGVYIPVHFDRIKFYKKPGLKLWVYGYQDWFDDNHSMGNLWLYDDDGGLVAEIQGFKSQYLKGSRGEQSGDMDRFLYEYKWNLRKINEEELHREPQKYLSANSNLKKPLEGHIKEIIKRPINKEYEDDFIPVADELTCFYIIEGFKKLGVPLEVGQALKVEELQESLGVIEKQRRFFEYLFKVLAKYKYLKKKENAFEVVSLPKEIKLTVTQKELEEKFPNFDFELLLLGRCASELDLVLKGEVDPVQLVFANDQWDAIVRYYSESHSFKKYNELMQIAVSKLIEKLPEEQTLRVLEVGAGTGGVTQAILPLFPQNRTEYHYTDLSTGFLAKAQKRFGNYPFVQYQIMDIEKDIIDQGIDEQSFDIVVASDVLHATTNIVDSLNQVKKILAPGGALLMLEVINNPIYFDLIFGMTEGVWLFNDLDLRPDHAIMDAEHWKRALDETGYTDFLSETDQTVKTTPAQAVIVANTPVDASSDAQSKSEDKERNSGLWLVLSHEDSFTDGMMKRMQADGKTPIIVKSGSSFSQDGSTFTINGRSKEDWEKLVDWACDQEESFKGILYGWADLSPKNEEINIASLESNQFEVQTPLYHLFNALDKRDSDATPKFVLLTYGAQKVEGEEIVSLSQSPLWGLVRVYLNERPKSKATLIDLSKEPTGDELNCLLKELNAESWTREIAYRGRKRFFQKLERTPVQMVEEEGSVELPASGGNYHTTISEYGLLDNLKLRSKPEKELKDNEIEIEVRASALNFRDIMVAMGLLSDEAIDGGLFGRNFGLECSGVVSKVGASVKKHKVRDEVLAMASDTLSGSTTCLEEHAIPKPSRLSYEEAATLPAVYLTAYYSLIYQCRIQKGETVLIHAASGGVGIAAVNIAKKVGAKIIATASSPEKHAFLKKMGVEHIFNSRTLVFADEIKKLTNGKGVDIVLNSLSGKAISQSIKCLAPYGRFVEIGKTDIYRNSKLGLQPFGNNLSYFGVDIDRMLEQKPGFAGKMFEECINYFVENGFEAHPFEEFPVSKVNDAFMFMSQARHIGKVVVSMKEDFVKVAPLETVEFNEDSSYLVTGGASGFGLAVAGWMAKKGAKHLILVSRSGPKFDYDKYLIQEIKKQGTTVYLEKADMTSESDVVSLFKRIKKLPELKGIMHAATVFDDRPIEKMDEAGFIKVMKPKMNGAWLMHKETEKKELDFFVNFSSISAIYGTPGQSNYTASNTFLDMFAHYRRSIGLPCTTINWGAIGEVGFVAREEKVKNILESQGWFTFSQRQVQAIFERVLTAKSIQKIAVSADWETISTFFGSNEDERIKHLVTKDGNSEGTGSGSSLKDRVLASPEEDRLTIFVDEIREAVARVLGTSANKLDIADPITKMGLDSLMANQLRNWIQSNVGLEYSMMKIMRGPSVEELAGQLLEEISGLSSDGKDGDSQGDFEKWIIRNKTISNPRLRLFCFPYFAGGASTYNTWHEEMSNDVEVCAIQLPGREERANEEPMSDMDELMDKLISLTEPLLDRPIAIYAHSMGSGLAYEFARRLRKDKDVQPVHLYLSAWQAPHLPTFFKKLENMSEEEWKNISDEEVVENVGGSVIPKEVLSNEELRKELLPGIRADIWMFGKTYQYKDEEPLSSPITAFRGSDDSIFTEDHISSWSKHSQKFTFKNIEGGDHLFIRTKKDEVIDYINESLH